MRAAVHSRLNSLGEQSVGGRDSRLGLGESALLLAYEWRHPLERPAKRTSEIGQLNAPRQEGISCLAPRSGWLVKSSPLAAASHHDRSGADTPCFFSPSFSVFSRVVIVFVKALHPSIGRVQILRTWTCQRARGGWSGSAMTCAVSQTLPEGAALTARVQYRLTIL